MPGALLAGLCCAILAGSIGCSGKAWTVADPWHREPVTYPPIDAALDPDRILMIPDENQSLAQERLEESASVRLSMSDAIHLLGRRVEPPGGTEPYLARAVFLNEETGSFSASWWSGELYIHHSSLGRRAVPMKRAALIIFLPSLTDGPAQIYATCSMAE